MKKYMPAFIIFSLFHGSVCCMEVSESPLWEWTWKELLGGFVSEAGEMCKRGGGEVVSSTKSPRRRKDTPEESLMEDEGAIEFNEEAGEIRFYRSSILSVDLRGIIEKCPFKVEKVIVVAPKISEDDTEEI